VRNSWISFTSDYGVEDGFVAACAGVIATIAPDARVLTVTHSVPPQDIRRGATVLAQTVPYCPQAVHLAVVDPDVGTPRRPVAIVAEGGVFVGPDNGLLMPAADALGGARAAYELVEPKYRLSTVSATFHGRDIFAPAAAHLATGVDPELLGPAIDPAELVRLPKPRIVAEQGELTTEVLGTDHFGNLQLAARLTDLAAFGATPGETVRVQVRGQALPATVGRTFADVPLGETVVFVDSAGHVAIAVNGGSAANHLRCRTRDSVVLRATR
jgi:S-adenosyl-L-methionine hydrolase (adenosine-forming)